MRIVLIGRPADRDRLRGELIEAGMEIAGEAPTIAMAREARLGADAFVVARPLASPRGRDGDGDGAEDGSDARIDEPLTSREAQVLSLLAEGLPNKLIAARLAISDQTVKFHVAAIIGKLGARNRTDAVQLAMRRGLIVI